MVIFNKIINILFGKIYGPICRLYARRLENNPADKIYRTLCSLAFHQIHRYWPDFINPKMFSEKIFSRMMFDRRPILTLLTDKFLIRKYVYDQIGEQYLIPLLWTGTDPERIPFSSLPKRFVIKTNHGCGTIIIAKNKEILNLLKIKKLLKQWLKKNFCLDSNIGIEWAYKNISSRILIEEYLDEDNKPPKDYKFFCFSGRVEYVQVSFDRFGDASERILDRNFSPLDVYNGVKLYQGDIEQPVNYDKMIEIAETLSSDFDFVRVDLYNIKGKIYFGELTFYPAAGLAPFVPRMWDYIFGEKWKFEIIIK